LSSKHIQLLLRAGDGGIEPALPHLIVHVFGTLFKEDAYEGPMPQTKFVLKKALELGIKPIVVINKIDKPTAQPEAVVDMLFDLFVQLGATDEQLDITD
jgi:GTP-binding protein